MVSNFRKIIKVVMFLTLFMYYSCLGQHFFAKDKYGEPILDVNLYTLNKHMSTEDKKIIDTTSLYVEYTKDSIFNPQIMIFHSDGFYELTSKKYFNKFRHKRFRNSAYYGGKFILDQNRVKIESFYPSKEGKTNYYKREISEGIIENDTVKIVIFDKEKRFIKKSYKDIF